MIILGSILICLGILVRFVAIKSLGSKFSIYLFSQEDVVTSGIYSKIRNPSYTGQMLILFGIAAINITVSFCYMVFIFYLSRACTEEQILSSNKNYIEYMKNTKRFIPYIM